MNPKVKRLITALLIIMLIGTTQPIYSQAMPSDIPAQPILKLPWPRGISSTVTKTTTHDKPAIDFDFKNDVAEDYVLASQDGTIVATGYIDDGYGDYVKIDHGNGYYTLYAHMATGTIRKRSGQVKQGQILGEVGCTGKCDGDHIHFELMYGSTRVWPVFTECNCIPKLKKPYTSENDVYSLIPGDFNRDGRVSILDYVVLFENYGWVGVPGGNPADINLDGSVDIGDYTILFENFGESLYSSSRQSNLDLSSAAVPNPPSNVLFTSEDNRFGTAVQVKLSWDDNSNDEDGFTFTWDIDGYASRSIIQTNNTPPPPPGSELDKGDSASSNNTNSVVAVLPCSEVRSTRSVSASISAFNATGSSSAALGAGTVEIPACPIPGDANGDRKVDGFDYVIWWQNFDKSTSNGSSNGDFNYDGFVDGFDYVIWWLYFGYGTSQSSGFNKGTTMPEVKESVLTLPRTYSTNEADQDYARIFFDPALAFLPPDQTFSLMFDSKSYSLAYAKVEITFDHSLINLTDEIQITNNMGNVIKKTSKDEANSTGKIVIVLGVQADNQPSTGLFEFANLPFGIVTTSPHQSINLSVIDQEVQLINININEVPFTSQSAIINPATYLPTIFR